MVDLQKKTYVSRKKNNNDSLLHHVIYIGTYNIRSSFIRAGNAYVS